jgi:hypothetical protein
VCPLPAWYNLTVLFVQSAQPLTPIIVRMVDRPTKEISIADILMGSVGITAIFLIGAALLGLALGGLFILYRRWQASREIDNPADEAFQLTQPPKSRS